MSTYLFLHLSVMKYVKYRVHSGLTNVDLGVKFYSTAGSYETESDYN